MITGILNTLIRQNLWKALESLEIRHQHVEFALWTADLKSGSHRQLTNPLRNEVHNIALTLHHALHYEQR